MNLEWIENASPKEIDSFKSICNQLLSKTFIVRTIYQQGKGRVSNPDYYFLDRHFQTVKDYLFLLDWDLIKDDIRGFYYVINTDEANRLNFNKKETAIILALRMIYEEKMNDLGLENDAICTVREVLEKVVTDYAILPSKPNMMEVKTILTKLESHSVLQRIEGRFSNAECKFAILPTIIVIVSPEKLNSITEAFRKGEDNEEA